MYQNFVNTEMINPTGVAKNQVIAFDKTTDSWKPKDIDVLLRENSYKYGPVKFFARGKQIYHCFVAAVTYENQVIRWGNYNFSQMPYGPRGGDSPIYMYNTAPTYMILPFYDTDNTDYLGNNPGVSIVDVIATGWQYIALLDDGTVWFMGHSRYAGMEGINNSSYSYGFRRVLFQDGAKIKQIDINNDNSDGYENMLAISTDNNVYLWGYNPYGFMLGGLTTNVLYPTKVTTPGIINNVKDGRIFGSEYPVVGITTLDGYFWMAGYGGEGNLGVGNTDNSAIFRRVQTDPNTILRGNMTMTDPQWSAPNSSMIVNGEVYMAGNNAFGQLGLGNTDARYYFNKIPDLNNVIKLYHGPWNSSYGHTCIALTSLGEVYTWGYNGNGQLGNRSTNHEYRPYKVCSEGAENIYFYTGFNSGGATGFLKNGQLWASGYQVYTHPSGATAQTEHLPMRITNVKDVYFPCQGPSPHGHNMGVMVLTESGNVYGQGDSSAYIMGPLGYWVTAPIKLI